jgi:hypothetical protein
VGDPGFRLDPHSLGSTEFLESARPKATKLSRPHALEGIPIRNRHNTEGFETQGSEEVEASAEDVGKPKPGLLWFRLLAC